MTRCACARLSCCTTKSRSASPFPRSARRECSDLQHWSKRRWLSRSLSSSRRSARVSQQQTLIIFFLGECREREV